MNDLLQRVEQAIAEHRLLAEGDAALVAVSGGVDSMVLLHALCGLSAQHHWKLTVAHFNHGLRGIESDADERFVGRVAKKLGLRFISESADVKSQARAQNVSIEMAARRLRHQFLATAARQLGVKKILIAHHGDDQVELFFLRLWRGAGPQGLGGMEWSSPSPANHDLMLLRPLLGETKESPLAFARAKRIQFREDATNRSTEIPRNRIRHQLLPLLRREYQPAIERAVLRSMELVRDESEFVLLQAIQWLQARKREPFASLHPALQRRVVQIGLLGAGVKPEHHHIEALRRNVNQWRMLGPEILCRCTSEGAIELRRVQRPAFVHGQSTLPLGARGGQAVIGTKLLLWRFLPGRKRPSAPAGLEYFDADRVGESITLRHWRPGDRFQPIGLRQSIKVQDFFVNQKIPKAVRHQLLMATTAAGEIFWIDGQRIGEQFKVTPKTVRMLEWQWR